MSEKDDGGPAWPVAETTTDKSYVTHGMSLREYFAASALQSGVVTGEARDWELMAWFGKDATGITRWQIAAAQAYALADAMISERSKRSGT